MTCCVTASFAVGVPSWCFLVVFQVCLVTAWSVVNPQLSQPRRGAGTKRLPRVWQIQSQKFSTGGSDPRCPGSCQVAGLLKKVVWCIKTPSRSHKMVIRVFSSPKTGGQ